MVRVDGLQSLSFFQRLSPEELQDIANVMYEKNYPERMNIFEEGTQESVMYIVKRGLVQIVRYRVGEEKILATFSEGEFFGEMSIFDFLPRSAFARAGQNTCLLEISKQDFDKLVEEKPNVAAKILYGMMEEMTRRLRKMTLPESAFLF